MMEGGVAPGEPVNRALEMEAMEANAGAVQLAGRCAVLYSDVQRE